MIEINKLAESMEYHFRVSGRSWGIHFYVDNYVFNVIAKSVNEPKFNMRNIKHNVR